jgi:hypothetical protein
MNGAIRGMIRLRIQSVDAVIAMVAVSSVATAFSGMVIAANVYDALHGTTRADRTDGGGGRPAARSWPRRRLPDGGNLDQPRSGRLGFEDARPDLGAAPERGTDASCCWRACRTSRPAVARDTRRAGHRPLRRL